jgi:fatty acid desaturase
MNAPTTMKAAAAAPAKKRIEDDRDLLRAAAELTRDISRARAEIYWPDMLGSAFLGYAALAATILVDSTWLAIACGVAAVLLLYRALLFIHELTHLHRNALPGFRLAWNLLVGIPLLTPSFMYEGVHALHHSRTRYGTKDDPEYLPLALMKPWSLPLFVLIALLAPPLLLIRSAILVPLGAVFPPIRKLVWERVSALSINPDFRRRKPEGDFGRMVFWQEAGASIWAISVLAVSAFWIGWRPLLIAMAVMSLVALFNQLRTLVAHLWENEGEQMTVTAQYLDSVNVPPPGYLPGLWAPVGLRFHALHHLLPSLPYHSLGLAHKRLSERFADDGSTYSGASYPGMGMLLGKIARSTMVRRG